MQYFFVALIKLFNARSIDGKCNNTFEQKTMSNLLKYFLESEKIFCRSKKKYLDCL